MHGLFTIGYLHLSNNIPKYSKRFNQLGKQTVIQVPVFFVKTNGLWLDIYSQTAEVVFIHFLSGS